MSYKIINLVDSPNMLYFELILIIDEDQERIISFPNLIKNTFDKKTKTLNSNNSKFELKNNLTIENVSMFVKSNLHIFKNIVLGTLLASTMSLSAKDFNKYEDLINISLDENIKEFVIEHKKLDPKISYENIKKNLIVKFTESPNEAYNFNVSFDNKKDTNKKNVIHKIIKNYALEYDSIGNIDVDSFLNNEGFVVINYSKDVLDNVIKNIDDIDYLNDFNNFNKNVLFHELSHRYLGYNEIQAVGLQKFELKNEKFKKDILSLGENKDYMLEKYVEHMVKDKLLKFSNNLKYIDEDSELNNYKDAIDGIKEKLFKNKDQFLLNEKSNMNTNYYIHSERVNNNKDDIYVHNLEYGSVLLGKNFFNSEDIGVLDKIKLENGTLDKLSNIYFPGGIYYNMMVFAEENNFNKFEINVMNKLIANQIFEVYFLEKNQILTTEIEPIYSALLKNVESLNELVIDKVKEIKEKKLLDLNYNNELNMGF